MNDITQQLADALPKIEAGLAAGLDCSRACKLNTHYHERVLGEAVAAVQVIKAALDAQPQEDANADRWVLMKRGLYYRPNAKGYTGNLAEAWIITEAEADKHVYPHDEPVTKHRVADFQSDALTLSVVGQMQRVDAENAQLKAEVERLRGELSGRCEHCGSNKIGPCAHCGAPQCCYKCCEIDALRARIAELESGWVRVEERLRASEEREGRYRHALNRIGFYFAGTEHQHIADKVLWVLAGNSLDSYAKRPLPPAPPQEEAK